MSRVEHPNGGAASRQNNLNYSLSTIKKNYLFSLDARINFFRILNEL